MPPTVATIDEALETARVQNPDGIADIILLTDIPSTVSERELESAGFEPTGHSQLEHGLVYGRLPLRCLADVQHIAGIKHISADDPQRAF